MEEDETDSEMTDYEEFDQMETSDSESVVVNVPQYLRIISQSPFGAESNDSMPSLDSHSQSNDSMPLTIGTSENSNQSVAMSQSPIYSLDESSSSSYQSRDAPEQINPVQAPGGAVSSASSVPNTESDSNDAQTANESVRVQEPIVAEPIVIEQFVMEPNVIDIAAPAIVSVQQAEVVAGTSAASTSSPSPKSRKRPADDSSQVSDTNDDGMSCSICLDYYTNSGEHRIVVIKCGHLFGKSCIERWLKVGCAGAIKRCPQCNTKASIRDIRIVYARRLTAMDTAENDRLKKELEKVCSDYKRLEVELVKSKLNVEMLEKQFLEQQKEIKSKFMNGTGSSNHGCIHCNRSQSTTPRLVYTHKLSKGGGRILAHNKYLSLLIASQASPNPVFQGYGIAKINSLDFNVSEFMFLHPKVIRDLAFHPHEPNVLLSVSLDKTAKLVDVSCNTVVQTYQVESPVWSCCWDTQNSNICFIGTQTGSILQFDRRRTDKVVLDISGDRTPIVSLSSVPAVPGRMISKGGIIACRLSSVWAFERDQMEGYSHRRLPLEGTFISLNFDTELDLILASARPSQHHPTTRHMVHQLTPSDDPSLCQHIHTFYGGTTVGNLSRSRLLSANNETLVCAFNESSKTVDAFHLSSFSKKFSLSSKDHESVTDLIPVNVNKSMYLSTLSENYLNVYSIPSK